MTSFNPDELKESKLTHIPVSNPSGLRLWLDRPDGDLFALLGREIRTRLGTSVLSTDRKNAQIYNWQSVVLGVAARERVMPLEAIQLVEAEIQRAELTAFVNVTWRGLRLFRSVARFASATSYDLPQILWDERKAWAEALLRHVAEIESPIRSKTKLIAQLRFEARELKERKNPFISESAPEKFELMKAALGMTHWDADVSARETRLPRHIAKDVGGLRRDIKECLKEYRLAMTALATQLKNCTSIGIIRETKQGLCLVGNRNKLIPITSALPPPEQTAHFEGGRTKK